MPESAQANDGDLRVQTICQMVFAGIAIGAALYWLRPVLLPFILAVFFVCGMAPVLSLIEQRLRAPRMVAVALTFLLGMLVLALLWLLIWVSVASLLNNADSYRARIEQLVERSASWLPRSSPEATDAAPQTPPAGSAANAQGAPETFFGRNMGELLTRLSGALMDMLSSAMMVLIFMFFLLLGGTSDAIPKNGMWGEIESKIRGYIVTKTVISAVTGGVFGLVLWLFGIELALVFGLLAFFLNFIPNVGPIIASLLPLPLIILNPELGPVEMALVISLGCGVQFVSGNIVEPKIMGDSFELHPVVILLTLMFWGMIWGIVGMFLATPVTAAIKILLEKFPPTRPLAEVLAGRLDAIWPAESK